MSKARVNSDKQIEVVDPDGTVIAIQKSKHKRLKDGSVRIKPPKTLQVVTNKAGDKILVPTTVKYPYSQELADLIVALILEGHTMTAVSELEYMPPLHLIKKWQFKYKEFGESVKQAREGRAEHYHDRAIRTAETGKGTKRDKLLVDTLKWAAESADPENFGKKGAGGGGDVTVNIMVDTGINRGEKEVSCEVTTPKKEITS